MIRREDMTPEEHEVYDQPYIFARWPWYFYPFLIIGTAMWILFFHGVGAAIWYYVMGGR